MKNEVQCILSFCIWTIIIYSIIKIISLFKGVICYNYLTIISKYWGFIMRARQLRTHIYEHWVIRDFAFWPAGWYFKTYTYINTSINRACLWLLSARATAASFSNFWKKGISSNLHQPKDQYKAGKYVVYIYDERKI